MRYEQKYLTLNVGMYMKLKVLENSICCAISNTRPNGNLLKIWFGENSAFRQLICCAFVTARGNGLGAVEYLSGIPLIFSHI